MTVTLTANYTETLHPQTVAFIEERLDENYALEDMLEFIDEYNETQFVTYYEEYVRCCETVNCVPNEDVDTVLVVPLSPPTHAYPA